MATPKRSIGYIGLGQMGGGMATHLVKSGYPVTVFDLNDRAVEAVMEFGAERAASPKEAAARADIVISSLPNPAIVEAVALGDDGIIHGARAGSVYIDMSSIEPETTRRVGAALAARGVRMLDVPVGKGPPAAARGDLTLMVGGDPAVVDEVADVLDTLGSSRFYCGPLGMGVTMKLVNNLVSTAICALTGEGMAIGAKAGLAPEVMLAVMSNTAANSSHLRGAIANRALTGDFAPTFKLRLAHKDLGLAAGLAGALGVPSLMGSAAYQLHALAMGAGLGDEDQSATIKVLEACTGIPARATGEAPEGGR
ncbi:MAG: NAD(P)-dependent oxidoreductase [Chloroflexi bacterium]|nr:NAD(P)-dependent oxidoreductase [Chloroflexota bacterium]